MFFTPLHFGSRRAQQYLTSENGHQSHFQYPQSYGTVSDIQLNSAASSPLYGNFDFGTQTGSLGKHPLASQQSSTPPLIDDSPPSKRSRKDQTAPNGRASGACTRCKRLKVGYFVASPEHPLKYPILSDEVHLSG